MEKANDPENGQISHTDVQKQGIAGIVASSVFPDAVKAWDVEHLALIKLERFAHIYIIDKTEHNQNNALHWMPTLLQRVILNANARTIV